MAATFLWQLTAATAFLCTACSGLAVAGLSGNAYEAESPIASEAIPKLAHQSASPSSSISSVKWKRGTDGLFYVVAQVNGVPLRFLVDTGASVTVLTPEDARKVGASADGRSDLMVTTGGTAAMQWTALDRISLANRELRGLSAAIVAQQSGVSLLGQNFLRQLDQVSIQNDELTIG